MNDLAILHLSDLHIEKGGRSYSRLHGALLNDIKEQINSIPKNTLVVVVTGDIINAGEAGALPNAKKFFRKLKEITKEKLIALYIVPGNHDKKRTTLNNYLVPAYRQMAFTGDNDCFGEKFEIDVWPTQKKAYEESGYFDLIHYIYNDLFEMPEISNIVESTFGVHAINLKDKHYCFVLLNTAWSCADDRDTRKLFLGRFQLRAISKSFHDLTDETPADMTFVLGHHPIECLYGTEQDELFAYMISYTEMSANAYLCGHTHDRNVINWSNNRHSIHTLMTGFGWPEVPSERVHDHYYSIYRFNLDLNSMEIYVRKTNDGSGFIPDLSIYTGRADQDGEKLVRPIRFVEAQGEITLNTANGIPSKTTFISKDFLLNSKLLLSTMCDISLDTGVIIEFYKNDLFDSLKIPESISDDGSTAIGLFLKCVNNTEYQNKLTDGQKELMRKMVEANLDGIYDNFQSYLQWFCHRFHTELLPCVKEGQIVRLHFRFLSDRSNGTYSTLCSSFSAFNEKNQQENQPSDVKYGDLLEAAFSSQSSGCLLYSVNQDICINKLKDKWKNFLTVVPRFERNIYKKSVGSNSVGRIITKQFPYITFGVTTNDDAFNSVLQCMDYYSLDNIISSIIQRYLDVFMVDIDGFLKWIRQEDKKESR